MKTVTVTVKKLFDDVVLPEYKHEGDSAMDIRAYFTKDFLYQCLSGDVAEVFFSEKSRIDLLPGKTIIIPTGIKTAIPLGYEIQIRPRSGLAAKHGIEVLNSWGTVDAGYRGEYGVILHNTSDVSFSIQHQDRIAQIAIAPIYKIKWLEANDLQESDRKGGFGCTGVK